MSAGVASRLSELVALARGAHGPWAAAGLEARLAALQAAGRALAQRAEELRGHLASDGLSGELARFYGSWIVHAGDPALLARYARAMVQWVPDPDGGGGELMLRRPDGVVALVTPGNSPTINAATLFSLLLPGNAVLVRAPAGDAGVRFLVEDILQPALREAGFSAGLVTVVTSRSREFLAPLWGEPALKTVVFFGNAAAGRAVAEQAQAHGKKVVLELEGSDHMLVWRDVDVPAAAALALRGFQFSTQPCPIPKHFLVHHEVFDRFTTSLLAQLPEATRTVERDPDRGMLVPVAAEDRFFAALAELEEDEEAEVLCGGGKMDAEGVPDPDGAYLQPTLVAMAASDVERRAYKVFTDEIAFPLLPVVRVGGSDDEVLDAMARLVGSSPFGLRVSLQCRDPAVVGRLTRELPDPGLVVVNDDHARSPAFASPWGGPKRSGGPGGENHLFWQKTSHLQGILLHGAGGGRLDAVLAELGVRSLIQERRPRPPETAGAPEEPAAHELAPLTVRGGVATLRLCRPHRHNAVNPALKAAIGAAVTELESRATELRCVVIRGEGPSFCSGADLKDLSALSVEEARAFMIDATRSFRRLEQLPVPVLAAVHGHCLGGGFELALHCDGIIAADDARIGFPETRAGLVTTAGSVARLMAAVGSLRARHILLTAEPLDAWAAEKAGLVSAVVPRASLDEAVRERAELYAAQPPEGLQAMKALAQDVQKGAFGDSWMAEVEAFERLFAHKKRGAGEGG